MSDTASRINGFIGRWRLGRTAQTAFDPAGRIVRNVAAEAQASQLPQMAAALAYRTIFGLLPMLVIGLVAIKVFASPERVQETIKNLVAYIGLESITLEGVKTPPGAMLPDDMVGPSLPPLTSQGIDDWLIDLLNRANQTVSFDAIGWVALIAFVYAAISMMVEIERAFNQIYKVPSGRSWTRRLTQYWTLLTLGGVGLFATFYLQQQFETHAVNTVHWLADTVAPDKPTPADRPEPPGPPPPTGTAQPAPIQPPADSVEKATQEIGESLKEAAETLEHAQANPPEAPWWLDAIKFTTTAAISTAILLLAYMVVPNTRVRFVPALAGALTGAILFEAGKQGFAQYVEYSATYAQLYGSLALIPLFMLWVYVTWIIVLSGLQIAYYLQYGREKKLAQPIVDIGPALVEPAAALVVMAAIARDFESGRTDDAPSVAKATSLSEPVVSLVLSRLAERGLLHRVSTDDAERQRLAYVLARPPGAILLRDVLVIGFEIAGGVAGNPVLDRLRGAQIEAAGAQTLADASDAVPPGGRPPVPAPIPDDGELAPSLTREAPEPLPAANGRRNEFPMASPAEPPRS